MTDWLDDQAAQIAEQERLAAQASSEAAARAAKEASDREAAEAPLRTKANELAARLVRECHQRLIARGVGTTPLLVMLFKHNMARQLPAGATHVERNKWRVELGEAWCIAATTNDWVGDWGMERRRTYPGIWIDTDGVLRYNADVDQPPGRIIDYVVGGVSLDTIYPPVVFQPRKGNFFYQDETVSSHCADCGPGMPQVFGPESSDPHANLLARRLAHGLKMLGAL